MWFEDFGPSLFRFEFMWLEVEGFKEKVLVWWNFINVEGKASFVLW